MQLRLLWALLAELQPDCSAALHLPCFAVTRRSVLNGPVLSNPLPVDYLPVPED